MQYNGDGSLKNYTACYRCVPAAKNTFSVSDGDIRTAL